MKRYISLILCLVFLVISSQSVIAETADEAVNFINEIRKQYINISDGGDVITDLEHPKTGYIYEKYEISFKLNADYENPFDDEDIAVDAIITYPSGRKAVIPAFYTQPMEYNTEGTTLMTYNNTSYTAMGDPYWCIRFSGDEAGTYSFSIRVVSKSGIDAIYLDEKFSLKNGSSKGFIEISEINPSYFVDSSTGRLFYGSGSNIAWVRKEFTSNPEHLKYEYFLKQAAESGTTLTRVWLCHWAWLEWMPQENAEATYSYAGLGYYNQCISSALDNIIEMCEEYGLRVILTLDDNNEQLDDSAEEEQSYGGWCYNPYNTANGGFASSEEEYYKSEEVRKYYKKRLRYIIARWGYSTSLMSLNLWNDQSIPNDNITDYLSELNDYTDTVTENYRTLLFGSNYRYEANDILDYTTQSINDANFTKPSVTQECYYTKNTDYFKSTLRNTLWSELFGFSAATMVWDHDLVDETGSWDLFTSVLGFAQTLPLHKYTYTNHYSLDRFASTWEKEGSTPTLDIVNGRLCVTCNSASAQSFAAVNLKNSVMPQGTQAISFYYDATENTEKYSDFRVTVKTDTHTYMPWYGKTYYFTPIGGETQTKNVGGSTQWSSWLSVTGGQSGVITIPLDTFCIDEDMSVYDSVDNVYKGDLTKESGKSFSFTLQQNGVAQAGSIIKLDDISWVGAEETVIAQNFSDYAAAFALSAETSAQTECYKTIQAAALGDIAGWAQRASENTFYINENDTDMLLSGISSKLYGSNEGRAEYKNDPTFIINCTSGGKMLVQLNEIGAGTNYFEVTKNGEQQQKIKLDGGRRTLEESEKYITIELDPGINEITISNSGQDWISIVNYYFRFNIEDTAGNLTVKRMNSKNQQLVYIYNTSYAEANLSIFGGTAVDAYNAVIPFYELENTEYILEIYDTVTGKTISSQSVTPQNNYYEATVSSIGESVAIKLTKTLLLGDVNGDGEVNVLDLVRIKKYFAGLTEDIELDLSDLSDDGKITVLDMAYLRQLLLAKAFKL